MRTLAIVFVIFTTAIHLSAQGKKDTRFSKANEKDETPTNSGSVFTHVENYDASPEKQGSNTESPHWYTSAEWWLFIIAIPTMGVIGWQAYEVRSVDVMGQQAGFMERQTTLAEWQATLMEAQFRQWIELENWQTKLSTNPLDRLHVRVDVVNPTDYPVTLTEITLNIGTTGYTLSESVFLPPKKPHALDFSKYVDDIIVERFSLGNLILPSEGSFVHIGQLGEKHPVRQSFTGFLQCGAKAAMHYETHMNPKPERPEQNQPAN